MRNIYRIGDCYEVRSVDAMNINNVKHMFDIIGGLQLCRT